MLIVSSPGRLPECEMILTNCAFCAAPLPTHAYLHCGRCYTRYCGSDCLEKDYFGTHLDQCEQIERAGGAEQYHADKKCAEAVAVAIEACAEDTQGQTCYICMGPGDDEESLVRGCACRGTAGFAHISCLAEQAKIMVSRAEENNLGNKALNARWNRWHTCSLCEQQYHGVVFCALGWACWKTYLARPEANWARSNAMNVLGTCLHDAGHLEDALSVKEVELSTLRRIGASEQSMLTIKANLAITYSRLGRLEAALQMKREVYSGRLKLHGEECAQTLHAVNNYSSSLILLKRFEEAKSLLRKKVPVARRVLGEGRDITLRMRLGYAWALYGDPRASLNELREAVSTLEDVSPTAWRVFGATHPITLGIERALRDSRAKLSAREANMSSVSEAVEAMIARARDLARARARAKHATRKTMQQWESLEQQLN